MRVSFDKYYMPLVEIKTFTALIDNKPFLINLWKTNKKYVNLDLDQIYNVQYDGILFKLF